MRQIKLCGLAMLGLCAGPWQRLGARQDVRALSCRTGSRHRIRCKSRWKSGAIGRTGLWAAPSNTGFIPAQQLGKAFDHYDMARDGIADLTYVSPGYQPGRFPIFDAADLPFMLSNAKAGSGALDDWYRKYAATEMKDVKFCLAFAHDPGTFHSRKENRGARGSSRA